MYRKEDIYEEYLYEVGERSKRLRNHRGAGVFLDGMVGGYKFYMGVNDVAFVKGAEQGGDRVKHKAVDTGGLSEEAGGSDSDEEGGENEEKEKGLG